MTEYVITEYRPVNWKVYKRKNNVPRRFMYANGRCKRCRKIVISSRAYTSIIAEALSRDPDETGGILLGVVDGDTWYVVEATDPGIATYHSITHHETDDKYHNHIYPVLSRIYKKELSLLGLWHRHPGSLNSFSSDDNKTNVLYAEAIEQGTLSFLLNFVPDAELTCYYLDHLGNDMYFKPEVLIGDEYFEKTDALELASTSDLLTRKRTMQEDMRRG